MNGILEESVVVDSRIRRERRIVFLGLSLVFLLAIGLRVWRTNGPFESNDHAQLAYFTTYNWGWYWTLQTHYGPLQPLITKTFASTVINLGGVMTEGLWRLPMGLVGSVLPLVSFFVVRRLTAQSNHTGTDAPAWAAALWTAVLPPLVTDARYTWGYETLGTACAAIALLAAMRFVDRPNSMRAWTLGACLACYLCSHLLVHALPLVMCILFVWYLRTSPDRFSPGLLRKHSARILTPPLLILALLLISHFIQGGGSLERFLQKLSTIGAANTATNGNSMATLWLGHFGWLPGIVVAIALSLGAPQALRIRGPTSAIWWWVVVFAAPLLLIPFETGRPSQYLTQASYAAVIFTATFFFPALQRISTTAVHALILIIGAALAFGSIDVNLNDGRLTRFHGVTADWGAARPDPGYKAAAWYVRKFAQPQNVICALHDFKGLEWLNAWYYFGRPCVAYSDLKPQESIALLERFRDRVDIIVLEKRAGAQLRPAPEFILVATIESNGQDSIEIFARSTLQLPKQRLDVADTNTLFDSQFGVRAIGHAPTMPTSRMPGYKEIAVVGDQLIAARNRQ